jgi:hypothetical protein
MKRFHLRVLAFFAPQCLFFFLFSSNPAFTAEPYKIANLTFHKLTYDQAIYKQNSAKYETVIISAGRPYETYVERIPFFTILANDILSVTIQKEKTYYGTKGLEEMVKDTLKQRTAKQKNDNPVDQVYTATFSLSKDAKKPFENFANSHEQQPFDLRLGNRRLGIVQFIGPFGGPDSTRTDFTTFLESTNPTEIQNIFAPIKNKTIWK